MTHNVTPTQELKIFYLSSTDALSELSCTLPGSAGPLLESPLSGTKHHRSLVRRKESHWFISSSHCGVSLRWSCDLSFCCRSRPAVLSTITRLSVSAPFARLAVIHSANDEKSSDVPPPPPLPPPGPLQVKHD